MALSLVIGCVFFSNKDMSMFFSTIGIRVEWSYDLVTRERRVLKKFEEVDSGSVWGPCVESLLGNVIIKWCVSMEVVASTSSKVSPLSTHGADRETYRILCKQSESMTDIQEDWRWN